MPATLRVKSEGLLVPPLTNVITVKNVFEPIGVVELFATELPLSPSPPFELEDEEEVLFVKLFAAA